MSKAFSDFRMVLETTLHSVTRNRFFKSQESNQMTLGKLEVLEREIIKYKALLQNEQAPRNDT